MRGAWPHLATKPMRNKTIFSVGVTALVAICALRGQALGEPDLASKALQAMHGAEEIVFVVRPVYWRSLWYYPST